jgi:hypothetical protein
VPPAVRHLFDWLVTGQAVPVSTAVSVRGWATGITIYLKNGGTPKKAPAVANHACTRTTQLYDRRHAEMTLEDVELATV